MTAIASEAQASAAAPSQAAASSAATAIPSSAAAIPSSAASAPPSSAASTAAVSVASGAGAPEKYELKVPANVKLDAATLQRTEALARAQGLSQDAAQGLVDAVVAEVQARDTALTAAWTPGTGDQWKARDAAWRAETLADAEVGGTPEKLAKSVELAQQVVAKFGGDDFKSFLETSGLGSHPAALKFLAKVGRSMSESTLIVGTGSAAAQGGKTLAEKMYGPDGTGKPKTE